MRLIGRTGGGGRGGNAGGVAANQHPFVAKGTGGNAPLQHIDIGILGKARRGAGKANGGAGLERGGVQGRIRSRCCAGRRLPQAQHGLGEVRPRGSGAAAPGVPAAHAAVGIQQHLGMAQVGATGQQRQGLQRRLAIFRPGGGHHRQHDTAQGCQGLGQQGIVLGVVPIFFGKQHVQANGQGLALGNLAQHLGMQSAPPRPAANGGHAAFVDQHQHHVSAGSLAAQAGQAVLHPGVTGMQGPRQAQQRHHRQEYQAQKQPR